MASIRTGVSLSLGLISTTVNVESAKDAPTSFTQLCVGQPNHPAHAPAALKQPAQCPACGPITDTAAIKKGKKSGDGYLVVDASAITETKNDAADQYKLKITLGAHPRDAFDLETEPGDKLYYLVPNGQADLYRLMIELVKETPDVALCGLYTPRSAASLFTLRVLNQGGREALVLQERVASGKLRAIPTITGAGADPDLLKMAKAFTAQLVKPLDMADYDNGYAAKVDALFADQEVQTAYGADSTPSAPGVSSTAALADQLRASLAAVPKAGTSKPRAPRARKSA